MRTFRRAAHIRNLIRTRARGSRSHSPPRRAGYSPDLAGPNTCSSYGSIRPAIRRRQERTDSRRPVAGPNVGTDLPLGEGGERVHDWMFQGKSAAEAEAWEVERFSTVGALVIGRRTLDVGIGPWGETPTFHAPCFVVTHRAQAPIVKHGGTTYTFVTTGIHAALEEAKLAAGGQDVVVMGGAAIAQQYLNAGLLDEVHSISPRSSSAKAPACSTRSTLVWCCYQPARPTKRSPPTSGSALSSWTLPEEGHRRRVDASHGFSGSLPRQTASGLTADGGGRVHDLVARSRQPGRPAHRQPGGCFNRGRV